MRPEAQGRFLRSFLAQVLGRPHCRLPGAFSSPPRQPKRPRSPPGPQPGARTRVPRGGRDGSGQGHAQEGPRCIRDLHAAGYPRLVTGTGPHAPSPSPRLTCSAAAQGRVYAAGGEPLRGWRRPRPLSRSAHALDTPPVGPHPLVYLRPWAGRPPPPRALGTSPDLKRYSVCRRSRPVRCFRRPRHHPDIDI